MSDGSVQIVGSLGRDPELRFTATGRAVCSFTVAVSHRYKGANATEWTEETTWMDVTAWGTLGENVAASLSKGNRVICIGRLKQDEWDDKESGAKRTKITCVADSIGPDLRWATAIVEKLERTKDGGPFGD
jgi:single-strand DNA-binding protein